VLIFCVLYKIQMMKYTIFIVFFFSTYLSAKTDKFRATFRDDPSTTIVIGWNQASGDSPVFYYDTKDFGNATEKYTLQATPEESRDAKGMKNTFVHLTDLKPNTSYFFIIKDSEGLSRRLMFQTLPNTPENRLSIIAGGDSRNMRTARGNANKLVGKLRPHLVMFGGDMTDTDSGNEWREWLDDWQNTITPEGRLTPVLPSRGNHEESNETYNEIFDLGSEKCYYALSIGGSLLRIYTLNSFEAPGGEQKKWLKDDLEGNEDVLFKITQYHLPIRPHVLGKENNLEEYINWAQLFGKYKVRLAVECDAHVAKYTYPLRPSQAPEAVEGFVRDDNFGTVYIGEGCWGAPLRQANRNRAWTRNTEAINQFHWIFVDKNKMEVRTVKTDCADKVVPSASKNPFELPQNIDIWKPSNGDVVTITQHHQNEPQVNTETAAPDNLELLPKLVVEPGASGVKVNYSCTEISEVKVKLFNMRLGELGELSFPNQPAGQGSQFVKLDKLPPGRYVMVVKTTKKPLGRYLIIKK
jgi:acid phosphatase type 7